MSEKTLNNTNIEETKTAVSDVQVYGNGDLFQLICKASSKKQGWMKSTKAMDIGTGVIIQVTTQQNDNIAEALTFEPKCSISIDENGNKKIRGWR